jgi:drug/metabolite transporter (DMT)-like permease
VLALPLADVMTYWLAAPIYVAALSPVLLGERVGWRRWLAIAIGFVGVIITLEPGSASFSPATFISIIGTMAFALIMVLGRRLRETPDTSLVFWQTTGAGLAGVASAPFAWTPIGFGSDLMLLALLGVVAMLAHMMINRSLKLADAATVAPLQYTLLLWGIVFGWLFFGEQPKATMLVGAALIIASGLFIFFREQQLKKTNADQPVTPDMP